MEYSDRYLREYLPRTDPPQNVPQEVEEEIAFWLERSKMEDRQLVARSTRWTYAMFNEIRGRRIRIKIEKWHWPFTTFWPDLPKEITIGLFDAENFNGFGISIYVPPSDFGVSQHIGQIEFPDLGASFPLLIEEASEEDHFPVHPSGATSAAWARCNSTRSWGLLTAGHAVGGRSVGRPVPLSNGSGSLARSYHPPIDAAFVHAQKPPSPHPRLLPVLSFPASGHPVTVELQAGSVNRTVFRVGDTLGVINTRSFPALMFTDYACSPGDSGALVRASSGEGIGVYLGSLKNTQSPNGMAGRVLSLEQAIHVLDITPYR